MSPVDFLYSEMERLQYFIGNDIFESFKVAREMQDKPVDIELNEWMYNCGDGCCTTYGTTTTVNGVEMDCINEDVETILKIVLEHLGYKVNITKTYGEGI